MESKVIDQSTGCTIEPRVAVVGIGGAGCNVVSDIYWADASVETIAINTDRKALCDTSADKKLYICKEVTKGEGTRGDDVIGRRCAKIHADEIEDALDGYDTVFIVAGVGGGTGSGVAPVVADIAQRLNLITFSVLVKPFSFESARVRASEECIAQMKAVCKMTTVIDNDMVLRHAPDATMDAAFKMVNAGISKFITEQKGKIVDAFSDQIASIGSMVPEGSAPKAENGPDGIRTTN